MNYSQHRRFHRNPSQRFFYIIVIAGFVTYLSSCKSTEQGRGPEVEVKGETSWYKGTPEEKQYLLNTFKDSTGVKTISWPPEELRRVVDISVDITGSGYMREVLFDGNRISLAEYNLRKLREHLLDNNILQPGDRIFVRLFGRKPGGQDVDVDVYKRIDYPGLSVDIQATVFDKRYHDLEIVASKISTNPEANSERLVDVVFNWFLPHTTAKRSSNETYMQSPLPQHIFKVGRLHSSKNSTKKLFIFATDGHFQAGDYYFSPVTYSNRTVNLESIKKTVEGMKIKPFTEPDRTSSVLIIGLSSNGNEEFRQAQEQFFRWFFDPLEPQSVTLLFN